MGHIFKHNGISKEKIVHLFLLALMVGNKASKDIALNLYTTALTSNNCEMFFLILRSSFLLLNW